MEARLLALSRAHDVLTRENWEGAGLVEIVREAMAPYRQERENRLHMEGRMSACRHAWHWPSPWRFRSLPPMR
jgi:two-component sensor histidine kinase